MCGHLIADGMWQLKNLFQCVFQNSLIFIWKQVLETYQYEDIGEVSTMSNSGLQMVMHTGGRVVLSANKAGQIRNLLNQYIVESNSGTYDYVKALAAFSSRDEGALSFKKGEVIAVVPKHDAYTEKVFKKMNFVANIMEKLFLKSGNTSL